MQIKEIQERLEVIDKEKKELNDLLYKLKTKGKTFLEYTFVGKFYKQVNDFIKERNEYIYINEVVSDDILQGLFVQYDNHLGETSNFFIGESKITNFVDLQDKNKWIEIKEDMFFVNYNIVNNVITNKLKKRTNDYGK